MAFEQLIESVEKLDAEKNYWFVRTDSGENFQTFVDNGYIGIGWDEITFENLRELAPQQLKDKISEKYNISSDTTKGKGKITAVLNKLVTFKNLKKGDLVIIPSRNSSRYAFGTIEDDEIYNELETNDECKYIKRRKVNWITIENVNSLDPIFYKIKVSRHSISNIKAYQNYIDNVTNNLYLKEGFGHYVIDIKTSNDINVRSLLELIDSIQELTELINSEFDLHENVDSSSIKLNLQSPGKIEFKLIRGKTLVILAAVLSIASGCEPQHVNNNEKHRLRQFVEVNVDVINKAQEQIDTLDADIETFGQ